MIHTRHPINECDVCAAQVEADEIGAIPPAGHSTPNTPILDDDAVVEIEFVNKGYRTDWRYPNQRARINTLCRDWQTLRREIARLTTQWCECGHVKDRHGFFSDHDECYECDQASPDLCCEWRPAPRPNEHDALCATVRALRAENERLRTDVGRFSALADERHDLLSAERRANDDLRAERSKILESLERAQEERNRLGTGLANLYHVITGRTCDKHVALGMATSAVSSLQFQLEQVTKERDTLRNSASLVAFQAHQIDGDIAASLLERGRSECVTKVREYLTDCRDEERGIIKAIALELEQLK
jgi:hypothetical protein